MRKPGSPYLIAVLQAVAVTVLWSSSWVLIKIGLQDIPPLPFAGLRYMLAFLCLLPLAIYTRQFNSLRRQSGAGWVRLIVLGLLFYAVTQGAQFLSLFYLEAATVSLLLSFSTVLVALLGILYLQERPTGQQWLGTACYLVGVLIYLGRFSLPAGQWFGLGVALVGVLANALSAVLGRQINRDQALSPLAVTVVSMGIGAVVLMIVGIAWQGMPRLSLFHWGIILWLAVVNSALAYTLWNHTLRTLSATESSIINNTMLFQIAILAWLFLDEPLNGRQIAGMVLAMLGTLLVQIRWSKRRPPD